MSDVITATLPVTQFTTAAHLSYPHPHLNVSSSASLLTAFSWDPKPTHVPQGLHEIAPGFRRPGSASQARTRPIDHPEVVAQLLPPFDERRRPQCELRGTRGWLHAAPKVAHAELPHVGE